MKQIALLSLILVVLSSCIKEGPMGPQGYPGEDGDDASTPQLYYFDIPVANFNKELFYEDNNYFYNDAWVAYGYIQGVTITENDLVMVFMHQTTDGGPDNYFQALPYLDYVDGTENFTQYSYGIMDDNGDLIFTIRTNDGRNPYVDMNATWSIEYNVYLVKGTESRKAEIPSDVNFKDETALKQYLGISERKKVEFIQH
ncbi:MAG: hypothetical protein JXR60_03830 [Bacteroidales bacterium]|nr:hypothetical protein [Bacteroidales bacterium]